MGEKDGENKAAGPTAAVLKLDLHCQGCANKVKRAVRHFEGVEKVKLDYSANKLTVTGNVDPAWLRERVEYKTKKKVELVWDGGDKKAAEDNEKPDKKTEEKKADDKKPKEPAVNTVVMKIKLHCDGCAHKVKRAVLKNIDGVNSVKTDLQTDLITVTGTMDVKELATYVQQKLKKSIEIIPPKKDSFGGEKKVEKEGGDKKDATSNSGTVKETKPALSTVGGGEESKSGEGTTKVEVNKLEYNSYNPQTYFAMPMYNQSYANHDYGVEAHHHRQGYAYHGYPQSSYAVQYAQGPPPPPPTYLNLDDQMFSDENPNGCSLM